MADQQPMVYTLGTNAGIKRDGTTFESREYSDGLWCRFQRGIPKKMGGYQQMFRTPSGIPRGMIVNPYNGVNYMFIGNQNGINVFTSSTNLGIGSGPYTATIYTGYSQQTITSNTTTSITINSGTTNLTSLYPAGTQIVFSQTPGATVYTVSTSTYSSPNTVVNFSPAVSGSPTTVWVANTSFSANSNNLWQFDLQYSPLGGNLQVLAHPGQNLGNIDSGIQTQVLVGNVLPGSNQSWSFYGLADTGGQNPTYKPVSVDGGVCVIYPFVFVYGSNGFISNNNVSTTYGQQTLYDWNGPLANQVNMASSKIVKGVSVRGGTNSPSGLFWATDSLIRASFTADATLPWRYDILSSQISIMSSNSVVEMDGIYYWMGVDRFYAYNGAVKLLANDKNVDWLFNNINYQQRQKVWATKVPRYNEIWFFYPRGTNTECSDAIIYNTKDDLWYDAGSAEGARRSCGYTTELLPSPVWCGWDYTAIFSRAYTVLATPTGQTPATISQVYLAGNQTTTFYPGAEISLSNITGATSYVVASSSFIYNTSTESLGGVTLVTITTSFPTIIAAGKLVYFNNSGYGVWQHEIGTDKVTDTTTEAIPSYFTTCDISWVGGNPSQDASPGVNLRMHLTRVEPDFEQSGNMNMYVLGRKFARGDEEIMGPYTFGPSDGKIDTRLEYREMRLQFESNEVGGNYQMGRNLVTVEYGDQRP